MPGRAAVFDSGLGSLSVALALRAAARAEIVYLADRRAFPYGARTRAQLARLVGAAEAALRERFSPEVVVVGSVTPTLLLGLGGPGLVGALPPVAEAAAASRAGSIGVLATRSVARSAALRRHVARELPAGARARVIDATELVALAESGAFLSRPRACRDAVRDVVGGPAAAAGIDSLALSSTHLAFLSRHMRAELPGVRLADPAPAAARAAARMLSAPRRAGLSVYATAGAAALGRRLAALGVPRRVRPLSVPSGTRARSRRRTASSARTRRGRRRRRL